MSFAELEQALGHQFSDPDLLERALTHSSVSKKAGQDNERLEFLGDRVLGLVVADLVYRQFPKDPEGKLAARFNHLVRRESCALIGEQLGLNRYLRSEISKSATNGKAQARLLANACEAVIGALYLDGGMAAAESMIKSQWAALLAESATPALDAKTALQEWAQGQGLAIPAYDLQDRSGPDHAPHFIMTVTVEGHEQATGEGDSKRAAEQSAAQEFLKSKGIGL